MPRAVTYVFGPFHLDVYQRRLTRGAEHIALGDRSLDVLLRLVSSPGQLISKNALIDAVWHEVAVTDNSLEQAISGLRRALGQAGGAGPYIQTVARNGYRFTADVSRIASRETDDALDALLAPHRLWLDGVAALETLGREQAVVAQRAFECVIETAPGYAPAHVGLATALAFQFESTRADLHPDADAISGALEHGREACRLDPDLAENWATLGFVLHRTGDVEQALAASRRAVALEPDNWRHALRLAYVSWGEERLRAASRTLKLLPGIAMAHWLAATVHVARQAFDLAERELDAGAAAQDAQDASGPRFGGIGLHWLRGLVRLRAGDRRAARESFVQELSFEPAGHLYARELAANTWYALGALHLRAGEPDEARRAFDEAIRRVPAHPFAAAAGAAAGSPAVVAPAPSRGRTQEPVIARAIQESLAGRASAAAGIVGNLLRTAPPGSTGWIVPVEPLLDVSAHADAWAPVLTTLRGRAA